MNYQEKLKAKLDGLPQHLQRRQQLLATFLTAFESGGAEEATSTLTQQLEELQDAFERQLADLQQLF